MINDTQAIAMAIQMLPAAGAATTDHCAVVLRLPFTIQTTEPVVLFSELMLRFTKQVHSDGTCEWLPVCIRVCDTPAKDPDLHTLQDHPELLFHTSGYAAKKQHIESNV